MAEKDAQTVADAIKRFKLSRDAYEKQRDRERDDLAFQVPELQWDAESRRAREGSVVGNVAIPPRPTLSISKLDQPIQIVLNQQKAAHLGVNIHPVSEDANADTAAMLQDLYRHIERDSRAQLARGWAFDRAVKSGMGFYRVNTVYDDQGSNPFDQKVVIERILQQEQVYLDPSAQMPDWSDGEYAFLCTWLSLDKFKRDYPTSALADYDDQALRALVREVPDWVRVDGGEKNAVLIAEYWRVEQVAREYVGLADGRVVFADEVTPEEAALVPPDAPRRAVKVPRVWWSVMNGVEELTAPQEWNGRYIPIIPVVGKELQPFDGERRFVGMIRPAKDGQKLFNFAASNAVEIAALEPRAPFLLAEGQDEGYEQMWAQANTRNFPTLKYKPTTIAGQPAAPPQRVPVDASRMNTSMALMQQADAFIQATTAVYDPSLGRLNSGERSGRALLALQQQADTATSHYLDSLASVAMTYEAKVVLDLLPRIYDRPGRIVQLIDGEDDSRQVMVNAPFVRGRDGRPRLAPLAMGMGGAPTAGPGRVEQYDLARGVYNVSVTIGRNYQTRLEQGAEEIGQVLTAAPALMPLIGPIYFKFRDFPGAKEIAELLKKQRAQMFPYLNDDEAQGPPPEVLVPQLQQQLQQAQQQLQQASAYVKTEQAKHEAQLQLEQMRVQADIQLQAMKNAAQIEVKKIDALTKGVLLDKQAENEAQALALEQQYAQQPLFAGPRGGARDLAALLQAVKQPPQPKTYRVVRDPQTGLVMGLESAPVEAPPSLDPPLEAPLEAPLEVPEAGAPVPADERPLADGGL
jgi:hypothetical protein